MKKSIIIFLGCFIVISISFFIFRTNALPKKIKSNLDKSTFLEGIWQLDYYPDSMFAKRSINDFSRWNSGYAYNIEIIGDSCQFIGWHESWWNKLYKLKENIYVTAQTPGEQYWEIDLKPNNKLVLREIQRNRTKMDTGVWYPYHQIDQVLTQKVLKERIAKKIFAGKYRLVFNDTLKCEKTITLDAKFGIKGIQGVNKYNFETEIDIDFPLDNAFGLYNKNNEKDSSNLNISNDFSFEFKGDTLLIKGFKYLGDDAFNILGPRMKMVKMK